jgi:hypothetical protein
MAVEQPSVSGTAGLLHDPDRDRFVPTTRHWRRPGRTGWRTPPTARPP